MKLGSSVADTLRDDRAYLPDLDVSLALFGSQEDDARQDANDDNEGSMLPCLAALGAVV